MSKIQLDAQVPDFVSIQDNGKDFNFSELKGKNLVLYFYPKDNTSGCTSQANDFKEFHNEFLDANTVVVGVSKDSVKSHQNFKSKYELPFTLLSDSEGELCNSFGTWVEKSMYGRKYMGIERSTFLINSEGKLVHEWRKVKVPGHVVDVIKKIKEL